MSAFHRFPNRLQYAIATRLGWHELRPVQELAGEAILDGHHAVVLAPTAGGKTEAAMFPVLAGMMNDPPQGVGAIYLAPIKALLNNQAERLGNYTEMVGMNRLVWHGDTDQHQRDAFKKEPCELLMTTPESLEVMLVSPRVPAKRLFGDVRYVVIDEVHAFAGADRGAHLMAVLERIRLFSAHDFQRIGLSATVGNPEYIARWLCGASQRSSRVIDPPKPKSQRQLSIRLREQVDDFAREAARESLGKKSLFFCQSRALAESVADAMRGDSLDVYVHHSSVSLEERRSAEERFERGTNACIVCTSTLELGIDVGGLDLTFQANAPSTVSSFLQRMGRTGRREGTLANMTFLCDDPVAVVQAVAICLLAAERWVESVPETTRCWPVLVHQLLALTLEHGGVSPERAWSTLRGVPDFSGISKVEFDALVEHMTRTGYLFQAGGLLSIGGAAEKVFGKKNFLEMYAVFSSPVLYRVFSEAGKDLGSLEQNFVDRLVEDTSCFLLGGRAWMVLAVHHEEKMVRVAPAPRGKKPSWGGFLPQFLGYEICQKMKQVLSSEEQYPFIDATAQAALTEWREDLKALLQRANGGMQADGKCVLWWTFAGGRINQTLKYAFEVLEGWKVVPDNFSLRIEGNGVSQSSVEAALERMRAPGFWQSAETRRKLRARVPEYRLSKFQHVLPDAAQTEMIGDYLLDFDGAAKVIGAEAAP